MHRTLITLYVLNFQISELRSLHEQSNYEPHYKRALATVTELQIEVQAYRDLKDTLDKAAEVQVRYTKPDNYEPYYKRALITVTELQIEVQAYRDLKDTLTKQRRYR